MGRCRFLRGNMGGAHKSYDINRFYMRSRPTSPSLQLWHFWEQTAMRLLVCCSVCTRWRCRQWLFAGAIALCLELADDCQAPFFHSHHHNFFNHIYRKQNAPRPVLEILDMANAGREW